MAVTELRDALLAVCENTYHYVAPQQKKPSYIVWGETGIRHAEDADDLVQILMVTGELWYYTAEEYDQRVNQITAALDFVGAEWTVSTIGRDNETHMIVYGFNWGIACGSSEIY